MNITHVAGELAQGDDQMQLPPPPAEGRPRFLNHRPLQGSLAHGDMGRPFVDTHRGNLPRRGTFSAKWRTTLVPATQDRWALVEEGE